MQYILFSFYLFYLPIHNWAYFVSGIILDTRDRSEWRSYYIHNALILEEESEQIKKLNNSLKYNEDNVVLAKVRMNWLWWDGERKPVWVDIFMLGFERIQRNKNRKSQDIWK